VETRGDSVAGRADSRSSAPSASAIARASTLNLIARLTSGGAVLALAILTTNVLDTHGRGVYAILGTWAGIANSIITGGTPVLAADFIHGRRAEPALHGTSLAVAVQSALVLVPVAVIASVFASGVSIAALVATAAVGVLVTYSSYEMAIAQARGDVRRVGLTDIGISLFPLLTTVVSALLFSPTVTSLMVAWAVGAGCMAALQLALAATGGLLALGRAWRDALSVARRSVAVALANGTALLCSRIDVLVVAAVLSASQAGIYSIPVALAGSLMLLSRSLLTATYRSIMTAPDSEVGGRLSAALHHSVIVVLVGGALSVPVVAVTAGFVFGDAYSDIWGPYAILVPGIACFCVAEVVRHFLITRLERQREVLLVSTTMVIANGVLAVIGAAAFGLPGAAASTTITYAAAAAGLVAFCSRALSVPMLDLAVPRVADLATYRRVLRSLLHRPSDPVADA
jgi:O-antigen/teichoic acid export membrane protein